MDEPVTVTDEEIESYTNTTVEKIGNCTDSELTEIIRSLASALKSERAERVAFHDVWEKAPKWATDAEIIFTGLKDDGRWVREYHRTYQRHGHG